jgi:outer membrane protein assembly factor BamD
VKIYRFAISAILICAFCVLTSGVSGAQTAVAQQDKLLYEHASKALKNSDYASARKLMEEVINGYPDSKYVPIAKLAIADAWYQEGNDERAEMEYQDFVTFFPNHPEAGEAGIKIESIRAKSKI